MLLFNQTKNFTLKCQVLNVDLNTAEKYNKEPWNTLVSYQRVDKGIK